LREIASHINIIVTTLIVLIAIFLATRQHTGRPVSNNSIVLINCLPFLAVFLFTSSVLAAWYSGNSNHVAISGLMPWNDAHGYYLCAHTILDKWEIGYLPCQRRPIYSFYLATLIGMSGRDLQITLLLQAVLLGSVVYLFARQLGYYLGYVAALVAFALLFLFASDYSMTALTENAGLFYGTLGFVFIWAGTKKQNIALISFGAFMLTLGLNARAGAFFVLPFIVIWAAFFSGLKRKKSYIMVSSIILAISAGFIFNASLLNSIDARQDSSHGNFSYVIYGITAGGENWNYVYKAEPDIFSEGGSGVVIERKIYAASLQNIIHQPQLFIKGYLKGFLHYLEKILHFVRTTRHEVSPLRITFVIFWLIGLISCFKGIRRDPHLALVASMVTGVVLSAPLITFSGGNRVFATTLPVDAALVAIGFAALQQMIQNRRMVLVRLQDAMQAKLSGHTIVFAIVMLFLIFPGPLLMRQVVALAPINTFECVNGLTSFVLRPGLESASLRITGNKNETSLFPLQISVEDYRKRLTNRWVHLDRELIKLPKNTTLILGYQRSENGFGNGVIMIWPDSVPVKKGSVIRACAKTSAYEKMPGFARVETVDIIAD